MNENFGTDFVTDLDELNDFKLQRHRRDDHASRFSLTRNRLVSDKR